MLARRGTQPHTSSDTLVLKPEIGSLCPLMEELNA